MGTLPASKPSSMPLSKSGAFKCPVKPSPWVVIWSWEQLIYDDDTRRTPTQNANHDPRRFEYGTKRTNSIQHVKKMNSENTILLSADVLSVLLRCQFCSMRPNKVFISEKLLTRLSSHSATPFFWHPPVFEWALTLECHVKPGGETARGWRQKKIWQINYGWKQHSPDSGCFPALTDSKQCSERQLRIALRGYQRGSCARLSLFVRARENERGEEEAGMHLYSCKFIWFSVKE